MSTYFKRFCLRSLIVVRDDLTAAGRSVLVAAAPDISAEVLNELLQIAKGLPYVAITPERAEHLSLPRMPTHPHCSTGADLDMLVSVEAREGIHSGISMADRSNTIRCLAAESPDPRALVRPGHIFPVLTRPGGVLTRPALPEAALDVVRAATGKESAVFVDLLNDSGGYASTAEQASLCLSNDLPMISLSELICFRLSSESSIERVAEARLPSKIGGDLRALIYRSAIHHVEHLAIVKGSIDPGTPTYVRVQRESLLSDVFGDGESSSRASIHRALEILCDKPHGVMLYLRLPEGTPFHQRPNSDSALMVREYGLGAQILRDIGVGKVVLITNSATRLEGLSNFGIQIIGTCPLSSTASISSE